MEPEFITFRRFNDIALADELTAQLLKHDIEYQVEQGSAFNPSFSFNSEVATEYFVKIKSGDFERVNQLLKQDENDDINEIDKDYYLFDFTDNELINLIAKADEWSPFDVALAQKILADRGKAISDETIAGLNRKRIEDLKRPDPPQTFWIIVGYAAGICGGLLGIFIGRHLATYKKTLPDGEIAYAYNESDRRHGKRIFFLSCIVLAMIVIYKIIQIFNA